MVPLFVEWSPKFRPVVPGLHQSHVDELGNSAVGEIRPENGKKIKGIQGI